MASEASLAGMSIFGRQWKSKFGIKKFIPSDLSSVSKEDLERLARWIRRKWVYLDFPGDTLENGFPSKLDDICDYLEAANPDDEDEICDILELLYDFCDYYRVVIV